MNAPLGDAPQSLTGLHAVDADGAKVGTVQQVYRDDATNNEPEWITVRTGLFGMKETFIPLAGARRTGDELHVPHAKATIKNCTADRRHRPPRPLRRRGAVPPLRDDPAGHGRRGRGRPHVPVRPPGRRGTPRLPPPRAASATS